MCRVSYVVLVISNKHAGAADTSIWGRRGLPQYVWDTDEAKKSYLLYLLNNFWYPNHVSTEKE